MSRSNVRTLSESRTLRKGRKNGEACVKVVIQQNNNLWLILINMQKKSCQIVFKNATDNIHSGTGCCFDFHFCQACLMMFCH